VWPNAVREVIRKVDEMNGGIVGLVGLQGVGKSSALLAIEFGRMLLQSDEHRKKHKSGSAPGLGKDLIRFKWHTKAELLLSLMNGTHDASGESLYEYSPSHDSVKRRLGKSGIRDAQQSVWVSCFERRRLS